MANSDLYLEKTVDFCNSDTPRATVIFIHGIASNSTTFDELFEFIKNTVQLNNFRFVAFDLLGAGKSLKNDSLNYDYDDQLTALYNSIAKLKIITPIILAGHSLGTFIVTRYASRYPEQISKLVLISAPVYTPRDLDDPAFMMAVKAFEQVVGAKDASILQEKSFKNSMRNIVLDKNNYDVLVGIKIPTTIIYGTEDQLIGLQNYEKLLNDNKTISAIKTDGKHGVTEEKFSIIAKALEEESC